MNVAVAEKHLFKMKFREKFAFLFDIHSLFYFTLLLIGVGIGFFGYALFTQSFTTPFSGDFAQQYFAFEYNFYDDWWTFFKTGKFPLYDSNTFLGADNIVSNTYYGLFSPFTFPILFFPRSFVPQAMALCSIAKLVVGALLFRVYLKYMGASEGSARTFSIAYAFMGWTAFYLWFNNFAEVLTFFPLILFGIEKIIREKKIWACSLGYCLMGLGNYFFLLTFGIFGVIYAGFRFFQTLKERGGIKNYKEHLIVIGMGIAGFAIGYLMAAVVLFPAIFGSFGISRATGAKYLDTLKEAFADKDFSKAFEIIFTWWHPNVVKGGGAEKYYFMAAYPVASFFYPTISCRYVNIVGASSFENAGSSIFFFTPCIIMFCACVYRSIIHKKISHFIAIFICVACLFIPFFYFLCGAFTNNYGRWEIIVPAMGLVYIALNFDHRDEIPKTVIFISGIIAMLGMILALFLAFDIVRNYGYDSRTRTSNYVYSFVDGDQMNVVIYEVILCAIEVIIIGGFWKKKYLNKFVRLFIVGEAIVMGNIVANMHYLQDIYTDVNTGLEPLSHQVELISKLNNEDKSFFRMVSSMTNESHVNLPQAENYNGLTTFHTFYNNEVDDFIHMTDMTSWDESWSAHYYFKHQYMESFLGVKYYLTKDSDTTYYYSDHNKVYDPNVPLNFSLKEHDEVNGYRIYQNDYHINFGIAYDTLYYKHRNESNPKYNAFYKGNNLGTYLRNEEVLFKGVILNDEDLDEINTEHPGVFNIKDEVPSLEMKKLSINFKGIYAPYSYDESGNVTYGYMNPDDPTYAIKDKFKVDVSTSLAPKYTYQLVYEPRYTSAFDIGESGGYYVLDYPIRNPWNNYNACVWLINKDGKTIAFDELRYTESDNTNVGRALYSREPVYKIIVCALGGDYFKQTPALYYESYDTVKAKLAKAANNGITNLKRSVNDYSFETNYESEKFFVSQLAFTKGWKLKVTAADGTVSYPKVYNAQGGFVGFVAPSGETKYELSYMTPDLIKWALVSAAAMVGFVALTIVGYKMKFKQSEVAISSKKPAKVQKPKEKKARNKAKESKKKTDDAKPVFAKEKKPNKVKPIKIEPKRVKAETVQPEEAIVTEQVINDVEPKPLEQTNENDYYYETVNQLGMFESIHDSSYPANNKADEEYYEKLTGSLKLFKQNKQARKTKK